LDKTNKDKASMHHKGHLGVVAIDEERLKRVDKEDDKLDHLHFGEILLPPQVPLHLKIIIIVK